jgi:chromosome segregation ATPase
MERGLLPNQWGLLNQHLTKSERKMPKEFTGMKLVSLKDIKAATSELLRDDRCTEEIECKTELVSTGHQYLPSLRTHANQFVNAINGLKSLSDRMCDAADREAERGAQTEKSEQTELASLRLQVKEESLKVRALALRELEEVWKAKIEQTEYQLRGREVRLNIREKELAALTSKVYRFINRLNQTESESQKKTERLEAEVTELRQKLEERDERAVAIESPPVTPEVNQSETIKDLELRLQSAESKLRSYEAELKQKELLIQTAATKEAEIGKLISRLSSECERLSSELQNKSLKPEATEKKEHRSNSDTAIWKKILARIQEQMV